MLESAGHPLAVRPVGEGVRLGEPAGGLGQGGLQRTVLLGRDVERSCLLGRQHRPQPWPQHLVLRLLVRRHDAAQQRPAGAQRVGADLGQRPRCRRRATRRGPGRGAPRRGRRTSHRSRAPASATRSPTLPRAAWQRGRRVHDRGGRMTGGCPADSVTVGGRRRRRGDTRAGESCPVSGNNLTRAEATERARLLTVGGYDVEPRPQRGRRRVRVHQHRHVRLRRARREHVRRPHPRLRRAPSS